MSRDPYIDVKREVEQNLAATRDLLERYADSPIGSSSSRTGLEEELRGTLSLLEADLEDLDESVRIVEAKGDLWGLGADEVRKRRGFVQRVKRDVEGLRRKVVDKAGAKRDKGKGREREGERERGREPYRDLPDAEAGALGDDDREEQNRWEREEQQTLVRRQDDTLGFISGTLSTLASQAGLIGHEVTEQSEMLDDLGNRVDHTDSRLRRVQRTMNDFIRRNEETKSGWCICILIFVLIVLLVAVIIT